jgi:enoyl-CoA hydratase/carnithine racemase
MNPHYLISGQVGGGFCAGANLESLPNLNEEITNRMCTIMQAATQRLRQSPLVVVAAIGGGGGSGSGGAIGGGAELCTSADFRFISKRFHFIFVIFMFLSSCLFIICHL